MIDFDEQEPPQGRAIIFNVEIHGQWSFGVARYVGNRRFEELNSYMKPKGEFFNCNENYKILWQSVHDYRKQFVFPHYDK